jgi:hypothetical protein
MLFGFAFDVGNLPEGGKRRENPPCGSPRHGKTDRWRSTMRGLFRRSVASVGHPAQVVTSAPGRGDGAEHDDGRVPRLVRTAPVPWLAGSVFASLAARSTLGTL